MSAWIALASSNESTILTTCPSSDCDTSPPVIVKLELDKLMFSSANRTRFSKIRLEMSTASEKNRVSVVSFMSSSKPVNSGGSVSAVKLSAPKAFPFVMERTSTPNGSSAAEANIVTYELLMLVATPGVDLSLKMSTGPIVT